MKRGEEKGIKRWLKKKISINEALVVLFLITGGISFAVGENAIEAGKDSQALGKWSTAVGAFSKALQQSASAYGERAQAHGIQSLSLGSDTRARGHQSTAVGNDTYALGYASIALGTDDAATDGGYKERITEYDYERYFKFLYGERGEGIDIHGVKYGFNQKNLADMSNKDKRKYSPTLSHGIGSIAVGSRSIAFGKGAVSVGTLSFALKEGSTSLGTKTRAEGIGAMALGNGSNVFADFSVATGNQTQVLNQGGMAYGYQAYSAGQGSLALGREVSANAGLLDLAKIQATFEEDVPDPTRLASVGNMAKNIRTQTKNGVAGIVVQNAGKNYAIVVGNRAAATAENSLAFGRSAFALADNSAAIGSFSYADAENAMAIGVGARVFDDTSKDGHTGISALAIGKNSMATLENSVAIGVGSRTDYLKEDLIRAGYAPVGALAIPTTAKTGVISVGRKGAERRISNVASGYLNTDVANIGQLRALEETINLNIAEQTGGGLKYISANKSKGDSAILEGKMAISSDYKSYIEYISLRKILSAKEKLNGETVNPESKKKINTEIDKLQKAHADFASLQQIDALDDNTVGNPTENAKKYSLLLQSIEKKKKEALARIPAGSAISNYHNADNAGAKGADSIAIGYDAATAAEASNTVAIGKMARAMSKKGIALGNAAFVDTTATNGIAIGDSSIVNRANSVAIGNTSKTTGNNGIGHKILEHPTTGESIYFGIAANVFTPNLGEFAIGNGRTGTRRLTGLAAGLADTDAVNIAQYKALANFKTRFITNGKPFTRALSSTNTLEFIGNASDNDILTNATVNEVSKQDQITFSINKEISIEEPNKASGRLVTTKAVYEAIKKAKPTISKGTDDILTLSGAKTDDIAGNAFTLGINKDKLKETIATDFVKKDASNIDANKANWINKLSGDKGLTKTIDYKNAMGINTTAWKKALGVSGANLKYKGNGSTSREVLFSTGLTIKGEKLNSTEISGKNIWVEAANDGILTVKMSEKPNFTEVSAGTNKLDATGLIVGSNKLTAADGITATKGNIGGVVVERNQITGLTKGSKAGNAVEYKQFEDALSTKLKNGAHFTVKDETGTGYRVNLADTSPEITFKGIERNFVSPAGVTTKVKNIKTKIDGSNVIIDLNDKVVLSGASIAGVTFTNTDGKKEIHAGDAKITNLADGEVAAGSRAAVNGGQLFDVKNTAESAKTTADNAVKSATVAQGTANNAFAKASTNEENIKKNAIAITNHTTTLGEHASTLGKHTTAIDSVEKAVAKGFNVTASDSTDLSALKTVNRKLGENFTVVGDAKNITATIDEHAKITVKLSDNPTFGVVKINKGGSGKITGLSKGTEDTDATNLSQLKPIAEAINAGIGADGTLTAPRYTVGEKEYNTIQDAFTNINSMSTKKITFIDGATGRKEIALGDTIQFKGSNDNLKVALDSTNGIYNFSIIDNPTFAGVVTGNGFNANGQRISNVGAGSDPNDAVTYKQLQEIKSTITSAVSLTLESPVTYSTKINGNDEIVKKVGDKFYKIEDLDDSGIPKSSAIAIGDAEVSNIKLSAISKDGSVRTPIQFTNVAAGDISHDSKDAVNGSQLKPVLDALAMTWDASTNTIEKPKWKIGNETFTSIPGVIKGLASGKIGSLVLTNKAGENIIRGKDNKFYKVSDMNLDTLEAKSGASAISVSDIQYSVLNTTVAEHGTTEPIRIGNLKEGEKADDAVTLSQLTKLGLNPNDKNIKSVVTYDDDKKGIITLAGNTESGTNIGTKITNLADGLLSADSKDAVTGKQLYSVDTTLKELKQNTDKGWKLEINTEGAQKVDYDDTIQITSDSNLKITSTNSGNTRALNIATVESPNFGKIKLLNEKENATITGLTNKNWDATKIISGQAATEDQLKSAVENINSSSTVADKFSVKYAIKDKNPDYSIISLKNTYNPSIAGSGTRITNLAKGNISINSSDAINGSQMYASNRIIANFIGKDTFDDTTGMMRTNLELPSVTNNGIHSNVNNLSTALENLRYGFRIFGGKGSAENVLDGTAGATNVGNKENLAVLGDKNILTSVVKKKVKIAHKKKNSEDIEEVITESLNIPILNITMSETPEFKNMTIKESMSVGDSSNSDINKKAVLSINANGSGHITGLKNEDFNAPLNTLSKANMDTLIVGTDRAATEGQLSTIVKDYIRRDDDNVKYDDATKNKITFNKDATEGVLLSNVATAKDDNDAVNWKLLRDYSEENSLAVASVIGTVIDEDGKVVIPEFTKIGGVKPISVKNALDLLGEKIANGSNDFIGKIGDSGKDGVDGRHGNDSPAGKDGLNGKDLNTKTNALRRGEAGIIVYTTETGLRVGKAKDGNYYELSKIDEEGNAEATAPIVKKEKIRHSLVNAADASTTNATVLSNLANGKVAKDSKDAITGDQLHKFSTNLGTVTEDGSLTLNKLKFRGNISTAAYDRTLGDEVRILGNASVDTAEKLKNYTETNVATENTADGIVVKFSKTPKFTSVKATDELTVGTNGIKINGTEKTITGLKNLTDTSDDSSAVNKKFLDDKVKAISDKIVESTGNLTKIIGNGADGRDGKAGIAGTKGPTGKDGLNGKDLSSKINALRNGEAGTVVYTDDAGNRLYKGNDGKYYALKDIKLETGIPNAKAVAVEPTRLSLVNSNGETTSATVLTNLANGKVAKDSKDAITGDQLHKFATNLGTVTEDGSITLNKLKFRGNISTAAYDRTLGEEVRILGNASVDTIEKLKNYTETNVATENTADGIVVKFSKTPKFTSVKATDELTVGTNGIKINGTEKTITGLKNLTDTSDDSSAVNKKFLDDKVKAISDKFVESTGNLTKIIGNGADGRDGKDGIAGIKGPTGKDGLNGKYLTSKINALRNGEAGTVVYTDNAGNRLYKGNDGKYYVLKDINLETGIPNAKAVAVEPTRLSLVNSNGETSGANTITLDNLEKGSLTKESKEAITGSQLKDFADKVGLEVDKTDSTKLADPKLANLTETFVKDGDGAIYKKVVDGSTTTYHKLNPDTGFFENTSIDAIAGEKPLNGKLVDRINLLTAINNGLQDANKKGILFCGDNNDNTDDTAAKVSLGDTLLVNGVAKGDNVEVGTEKYIGGNIRVESSPIGMKIYTKANPEFDTITLNKEGLEKNSAVRLDQLNALRRELRLSPITKEDPDGNGLVGDQRDPKGEYPDPSISAPGGSGSSGVTRSPGSITNNVDSLNKREVAPIVYTSSIGEILVLGEDDKYYNPEDVKDKVYHENKWYDGTKVRALNGKLYDVTNGEEIKDTALKDSFVIATFTEYQDEVKLSAVNQNGETTQAIKLKNIENGDISKNSKEAVNGGQLNTVHDSIKNIEKGQFIDGKDGKIGIDKDGNSDTNSIASKGNTSKDSLNGKSTTDKANALRNGEAGTLVYTDAKGTRLFKGNDGKYYTFSDLESNGNVKKDAKAAEKVVATAVQYDGSTDKAGVVRVGEGEVSENSTEAVNGSQLHETNEKISKMASNTDARFETHEKAIAENIKRIETLDTKVNKGLANAAAMSGLSFMEIGTNQATVAAAVGGYKGTQAVAVGVQMAPTENVRVNAKVSVTPGAKSEGMYSVGAAYRFNFR